MDVIVCHWVRLVVKNKARTEGFGYKVAEKASLFYVDGGLID